MTFKPGRSGNPTGAKVNPKPTFTPKEERFVAEYLTDCNATAAALRAGYSARSAKSQGHELLCKPHVAGAIAERQGRIAEKLEITQEWVIGSLRSVATRCLEAGEAFNPAGANRALELLGKHLGMFADRTEHTGPNGGAIKVEFV